MNKEYINSEVQRLHLEGYSIRQIAMETGISKSGIGRIVKKMSDNASGTAPGTDQTAVPGTTSMTVPNDNWDSGQAQVNVTTSKKDDKGVVNEKEQAAKVFTAYWLNYCRESLQTSYFSLFRSIEAFLISDMITEDLAVSSIRRQQSSIVDVMQYLQTTCYTCHIQYNNLYMTHVLEHLYILFGQHIELEKVNAELKIKNRASIQSFIVKASKVDVFALK